MNNEAAITSISNYLDLLPISTRFWPEEEFRECSYSHWATTEILNRIMDHPDISADITIHCFCDEMAICLYAAQKKEISSIFETAINIGEEILYKLTGEHWDGLEF